MALAFIVFFGLVTTAILQFADTVELQQSRAQSSTYNRADLDGAALFAAQAAEQTGICVQDAKGAVVDSGGATGSYTTESCNPGRTADAIANQCTLCVLDTGAPASIGGNVSVHGPIAFDGGANVAPGVGVASTIAPPGGGSDPGFIGCSSSDCAPAEAFAPSPQSIDPVIGPIPQAPTPPAPGPCMSFDGTTETTLDPGTYCQGQTVELSGQAYTLSGGTYIFEDQLSIANGASLTATGSAPVLLYFTDGGWLHMQRGTSLQLQGGAVPGYGDIVIYVDPADSPPATNPALSIDHECTMAVQGTIFAPEGTMHVLSDGSVDVSASSAPGSGALIVADLSLDPSTPAGAPAVQVDANPPAPGYCWTYDDLVMVTSATAALTPAASPSPTPSPSPSGVAGQTARVIIETNCPAPGNAGTASGIISMNYGS